MTTHSTLAAQFAERIGLADEVRQALRQGYEQWDGKGYPQHVLIGDHHGARNRRTNDGLVHAIRVAISSHTLATYSPRATVSPLDPREADPYLFHKARSVGI